MATIWLANHCVEYQVRESTRARQIYFKIDYAQGLQVIVPRGAFIPNLEALLLERADWILRHWERVLHQRASRPLRRYVTGEPWPYLGQLYTLEVLAPPSARRTRVFLRQGRLCVSLAHPPADPAPAVRQALVRWYRRQAKNYLQGRADLWARECGVHYGGLSVRQQRTRWGSCSSRGNLNFNWQLILAPPPVIDYIVIHELCHLQEMNHSSAFWALVRQHCPDYQRWKRWLKDKGHTLVV